MANKRSAMYAHLIDEFDKETAMVFMVTVNHAGLTTQGLIANLERRYGEKMTLKTLQRCLEDLVSFHYVLKLDKVLLNGKPNKISYKRSGFEYLFQGE